VIVAYVPDLMDRSKLTATVAGVAFVASPAELVASDAEVVVVDLSRPGVLDVLPELTGRRVIGFGSHVDRELLDRARAAGCSEVLARSAFFARLNELLGEST
jgi:hypothetical protein